MRSFALFILPVLLGLPLLVSCISNEELERRLDQRNDAYMQYEERREMRTDARDERYEAWVDRVMD